MQQQLNDLSRAPQTISVLSFSGPAATTPVNTATFAQSQKIDKLSGTSLSSITVDGVSGLTDADIPDNITVSSTGLGGLLSVTSSGLGNRHGTPIAPLISGTPALHRPL